MKLVGGRGEICASFVFFSLQMRAVVRSWFALLILECRVELGRQGMTITFVSCARCMRLQSLED